MAVTAPDWLTHREGKLVAGGDGRSAAIYFRGEPNYLLKVVPVTGRFGCEVVQTINGRRLERGGPYPSVDDAFRGGLEDLRTAMGW
jgi:hypothetical protein